MKYKAQIKQGVIGICFTVLSFNLIGNYKQLQTFNFTEPSNQLLQITIEQTKYITIESFQIINYIIFESILLGVGMAICLAAMMIDTRNLNLLEYITGDKQE